MANSKVWNVLYRATEDSAWKKLRGRKGFWYADPILFKKGTDTFLFTEAFNKKKQKGYLAISRMENEEFSVPQIIMKRPFHLSYPCVFEYENTAYMIPETGQNGTLELWKGSDDLTKWEKVCVLLSHVRFADTTVYIEDGKVYLFSYEEAEKYKTHIFLLDMNSCHIREIEEITHSENIYRPAGKFYTESGRLFRPVQYNVNSYGEKILINEVNSIHPFKETFYKEITADNYLQNLKGCNTHTFSIVGGICAVDYLVEANLPIFERLVIIRKIRNKFYKLKFKLGI